MWELGDKVVGTGRQGGGSWETRWWEMGDGRKNIYGDRRREGGRWEMGDTGV